MMAVLSEVLGKGGLSSNQTCADPVQVGRSNEQTDNQTVSSWLTAGGWVVGGGQASMNRVLARVHEVAAKGLVPGEAAYTATAANIGQCCYCCSNTQISSTS